MLRKYFLFLFIIAVTGSAFGQRSSEEKPSSEEFQQQVRGNLNHLESTKEDLIHPNPSEGVFFLASIKEGDDISVFDGTGRMVFSAVGEEPKMKIDVTHLEKGIYSVIVRDPEKKLKINQKVMIK